MGIQVKISDIHKLRAQIDEFNKHDLNDITFIDDNGEPIPIFQKIIDNFKFCGLNNMDLILTDFYLYGFDDKKVK